MHHIIIYQILFICIAMLSSIYSYSLKASLRPRGAAQQAILREKHVLKESFKNQVSLVHQYWKEAINVQVSSAVVVDCTAGNGHDTLYLSQLLAKTPLVAYKLYYIDINPTAIMKTKDLLLKNQQNLVNCIGITGSHETFPSEIQAESVDIMCYNLGYMPGNIDDYQDGSRMCTKGSSTTISITNGLQLLKKGGLMTIIAYRGHEAGLEEEMEVKKILQKLDETKWRVSLTMNILVENSPVVYCVYRRNRTPRGNNIR